MSSDYDPSEFIDGDYVARNVPGGKPASTGAAGLRAPSREEVDSRVSEAQQKLAELKRAQEELERERAALEETRRRQMELQTGREEMIANLTRGIGLMEEAEFAARRDAEQMAKALVGLREAQAKVQAIREEAWTKDNFSVELTRALTTLENARMEYNSARLKFDALAGENGKPLAAEAAAPVAPPPTLTSLSFGELCRLGLGLTWPVAVALVVVVLAFLALQPRH